MEGEGGGNPEDEGTTSVDSLFRVGDGMDFIANNAAGDVILFGLSNVASSGSSALRLKLTSWMRSPVALAFTTFGSSSTTTPVSQSPFRSPSDIASMTSSATLDVERSNADVSTDSGVRADKPLDRGLRNSR